MKPTLVAGAAGTAAVTVDAARTIDFMGEEARVYATPMLVRDIEMATRDFLLGHLDPGEDSVGTRVELDHLAATLLGQTVTLKFSVAEVKGRRDVELLDVTPATRDELPQRVLAWLGRAAGVPTHGGGA